MSKYSKQEIKKRAIIVLEAYNRGEPDAYELLFRITSKTQMPTIKVMKQIENLAHQ